MRKTTLVLVAILAASFTLTTAEAAKKKQAKAPADPVYEWNVKNVKPMPAPTFAAPAAEPAKAVKKAKKKSKKKSKKA